MKTQNFNGQPLSTSVPDSFFCGYVTCALWSSTYGENGENNLDDGEHELSDAAKIQMLADCADFLTYCEAENIDAFPDYGKEWRNEELSGQDFWLTRNGHGAGYWDRGLENGEELTKAAKTFGTCDLYVGDDGEIYAS